MKRTYFLSLGGVLLSILMAACEVPLIGGPDIQATTTVEARQHQIETETVILVGTTVALSGTQTAQAMPTATPTVTSTSTPAPTATATPGPLVIDDNFNSMSARWQGCDICAIKDEALVFGPHPSADSAKGYFTLCGDCGIVHEYKMSVDATFISGVSDRGFGFVLREWDGNFIDLEISTWQLYGVWFYNPEGGDAWSAWSSLLSKSYLPTGYLHPGVIENHIDVEVIASDANKEKDLIKISFNGTLLNTIEIPKGSGQVGLGVGLHSIGVAFDNFHFESMPVFDAEDDNSG